MLAWLRELSEWYDQNVRIPIYLYYFERMKDAPQKGKKRLLYHLAKIYALTGTYTWFYGLYVKAAGRIFLAFLLGIDTRK